MKFLSSLAYSEQHVGRFIWNEGHTVVSIDGFPVPMETFVKGIHSSIETMKSLVHELFRGCAYQDILDHIKSCCVLDETNATSWFVDRYSEEKVFYSFLDEPRNNLSSNRNRLLHHLAGDSKLFTRNEEGELKPITGERLSLGYRN
jgi:hypothetical protein